MSGLIREVFARPAFDKRHSDPSKNYGIHGVDLRFYLKGPAGAIQFVVYTNWHLPHVQSEMDAKPLNDFPYMFHKPMAADIGYHARVPQYEDQPMMEADCSVIGGPCYYDGSSLQAEGVFEIFVCGGTDALWEEMEQRYCNRFGAALNTEPQP